jgi:hypothetical protein
MICRYPACSRVTVSDTGLCDEHRIHEAQFAAGAARLSSAWRREQIPPPTGEWAIAASVRDDEHGGDI